MGIFLFKKWLAHLLGKGIVKGIEEEYENNPAKDPMKIARNPHDHPGKVKKSPRPFCHATTVALQKLYREAYEVFVMTYRQAKERFLAGDLDAIDDFPPDCFIPSFARPFLDTG